TAPPQRKQFFDRDFSRGEGGGQNADKPADFFTIQSGQRARSDGGEQRRPIDIAPPGGPGIAANLTSNFVLALKSHERSPFARELREELFDALALRSRQFGEQIDEDRDRFGIVCFRQRQRRAQAHTGDRIFQQLAKGRFGSHSRRRETGGQEEEYKPTHTEDLLTSPERQRRVLTPSLALRAGLICNLTDRGPVGRTPCKTPARRRRR